ncbi:MAG: hypothetical protein ACYS9X_04130 [Planctomycetota bacterium]|jgi:hypothetical protein
MSEGKRGPPPEEPETRGLFEDVARAIGRTAGRTKDALARLGERGALTVAVRRLEHQRSKQLVEFGRIARKALAEPGASLRRDDPRVAEKLQALDRLDEKIARMRERLERSGGAPDEETDRGVDPGDGAEADGPREE